jgi:hypothetical protein
MVIVGSIFTLLFSNLDTLEPNLMLPGVSTIYIYIYFQDLTQIAMMANFYSTQKPSVIEKGPYIY